MEDLRQEFNLSGGYFEAVDVVAPFGEKYYWGQADDPESVIRIQNFSDLGSYEFNKKVQSSDPSVVDLYLKGLVGNEGSTSSAGVADIEGNHTMWARAPAAMPVESQVILVMLYTITTLMAVSGNIIVILVFSLGKRSRTDLRGFLINLACSDMIMAIFCIPFTFTMVMLDNWIFSIPMCPVVLYMQTVSVTASVCTNMAIGIDRFWVVTFPLKHRITKSRSKFVISVIWILALGLSSIQLVVGRAIDTEYAPSQFRRDCVEIWWEPSHAYRRTYTFFIFTSTYVIPLSILSLTYGIVGRKLWQRTAPGNADQVRDNHQLRSKRKVCLTELLYKFIFVK